MEKHTSHTCCFLSITARVGWTEAFTETSLLILFSYWLSTESLGYYISSNQIHSIFKAEVKVTY